MQQSATTGKRIPQAIYLAVVLGLLAGGACYAVVGATLGLFFGGIIFAALLVPPLTLVGRRMIERLLIAGCVCDGIALVWLLAWIGSHISFVQWLICYAMLIACCCALAGVVSALQRLGPIPASALTTLLALLWLASPVWMWPHLSSATTIGWLVPVHPLFAINSTLVNLGIWTERPIAYRYLLTLGQDVPYELPRTVLPAAMVHLLLGSAGFVVARVSGKVMT